MKKIIIVLSFILLSFLSTFAIHVFAASENITQINFTSDSQTIDININSTVFTTQTQSVINEIDTKESVSETTTLNYTSTSGTGQFSDANISEGTCNESTWSRSLTLSLSSTHANKGFCYKDSTPGVYTLTVSAEGKGWTPATQEITIVDNSMIPDTTAPSITDFTIPPTADSLTLPITTFTTDDEGMIEYLINETSTSPEIDDDNWTATVPVTYIFTEAGSKTLYAWVKDAKGNVSTSLSAVVEINLPNTTTSTGTTENEYFLIEKDVTIENGCTIEDTSGVTHIFPNENSPSEFLGICALVVAQQNGFIEDFEFIDFGWGLFLESINGVATGPNWDPSWSLSYNGESSMVGLTDLAVENGDTIILTFTSFESGESYDKVILHISNKIEEKHEVQTTSSGGGSYNNTKEFSLDEALSFLLESQKEDGSFSNSLYTDWVAIGVAKAGNGADGLINKLKNYLEKEDFIASSITDYERQAMALMSLGIDPYTGTDIDYISKIVDSFDREQIGDETLLNDDIFGLIVLQNVGYNKDDEIISKTISNIISNQSPDGSWGSVDMTAAGIEALNNFKDLNGVSDSISKAYFYILSSQSKDGGFENLSSTSWAVQALFLNNSYYSKEINNALQYLSSKQQTDGGVDDISNLISGRIWATSYAVPAVLMLSWNDILDDFKPKEDTIKNILKVEEQKTEIKSSFNSIKPDKIEKVEEPEVKLIETENNLGASVGNIDSIEIPTKTVLWSIANFIVNILAYIGEGFYHLILLLRSGIGAIFG